MIPSKLVAAWRHQASMTADEYCKSIGIHKPDKSWKLRWVMHYIEEANKKLNLMEDIIVGKKKASNFQGTTQFCAIQLDTAQKTEARKWLETYAKDFDEYASTMVRDGWKTSITWDDYNDCFIASSTMREEEHKNYDICVTSRSDVMWDAWILNYYKIYVMHKDQKLPTERAKQQWG